MTERDNILERLRSLRARAENEASSPTEVAAAASRAAKLIQEHDITEAEITQEQHRASGEYTSKGRMTKHPAQRYASGGISTLTETNIYWSGGAMLIVGLDGDREFAIYLAELILAASERGWKAHSRQFPPRHPQRNKTARVSYLIGFGGAVGRALEKLHNERKTARRAAGGTALVEVKSEIINSFVDDKYGCIPKGKTHKPNIDSTAALKGGRDGAKLNVERPIDNDSNKTELCT